MLKKFGTKIKLGILGLAFLGFGACATTSPNVQAQKSVDAFGQSLSVLSGLVMTYDNYPDCGPAVTGLCATPVMRENLAKALLDSANAYLTAEQIARSGGTPSTTTLAASLTVLQSLTSQLPVKK